MYVYAYECVRAHARFVRDLTVDEVSKKQIYWIRFAAISREMLSRKRATATGKGKLQDEKKEGEEKKK